MKSILAASILIAVAWSAHAAPNSALYEQLDALRSENAILAETLKNKEIQSKINNMDEKGMLPAAGDKAIPATAEPSRSPQVQMVSGVGDALSALIALPDGGSIAARIGTRIPEIGVVKAISAQEVLVVGKSGLVSLPFAGETGSQAATPRLQPLSGLSLGGR